MPTVEEHLQQKALSVPPGTFRHTVLQAARRFKSSWVELGKLLVKVRNEALYEQWGYGTFEAYCLAELRIKKPTADKLTRSFSFLDKHEPERVKKDDIVETAPAFEVVEVLAQAEERGQLSASDYKSIRDSIWSQEKPLSEMRRELTEKFPPPEVEVDDRAQLKRLLGLARKLTAELYANKKVPKAVASRSQALVEDIEQLVAQKAEA